MIHDLIMPHMGESIAEATILRWLAKEGDTVLKDQPILEIATDKVDSEISSPVTGILTRILFNENAVVPVDAIIAKITDSVPVSELETSLNGEGVPENSNVNNSEDLALTAQELKSIHEVPFVPVETVLDRPHYIEKQEISFTPKINKTDRFYSPLVKTIAREENISKEELDQIEGSGPEGRLTKNDLISYVEYKKTHKHISTIQVPEENTIDTSPGHIQKSTAFDIIEMDRMRRLIADHMVMSKQTSPHVTSFIEVDVTRLVNWRNKIKSEFQKNYNQNITYTPVFVEVVVKAIKEYPLINSSLNGYQIIQKKNINIGIATALPTGNLIVPVLKNADTFNLQGLTFAVNDLTGRARQNKLKPDEVTEGTFTITNLGAFNSLTGIPIINQPQLAILALGTIQKKPVVIETQDGDMIGIRQMMMISMSYDHRVIDGYLGGMFLKKVKELLETFDYDSIL